jgi:hypothetical protein
LDAEADRLCNAQRYERSEARRDTRAGHYERYGRIEADFLSRVGLALEPDHPASRGVIETALRSMKPAAGRDDRDSAMRLARGKKILAETLQGAEIPREATIPGMGERWGRSPEEQIAVLLPAESLELMTKKIVRGVFYIKDEIFIEPPYEIDFLFCLMMQLVSGPQF